MVMSLSTLQEPVGSVKPWLRADAAVPLPTNWLICDGSTVVDASSPYNGKALPDFRGRFPRGHNSLTNANFGADVNYYAGGTIPAGGADTLNLNHQHAEGSHGHNINNDGNHQHGVPSFSGNTSNTTTGFDGGNLGSGVAFRYDAIPGHHFHQHTPSIPSFATQFNGTHNHGGTQNNNGSGTDFRLSGSEENRPLFRELVVIIKIK